MDKCYLIYCSTGCSCCNSENHWRGPYKTEELAKEKKEDFLASRLLASQYSERGNYDIRPASCEQLPDGRLIIDGERVIAGFPEDTDGDDYYGSDRFQ